MPLIVFEGIDGSGTTTISKRIVEHYEQRNNPVCWKGVQWTCEPTEGPIGKLVRGYFEGQFGALPSWRTMMHLFQADREQHVEQIQRWLSEDQMVVCDRYWLSTFCYQPASAKAAGYDPDMAKDIISRMNAHAPLPNVTILLEVSVEEAQVRRGRPADHYEKNAFLEQVRQNYLSVRGQQLRTVNTTGKNLDDVFAEVDVQLQQAGY